MALTESNMLPLGTVAPHFSLPDTVSGKTLSLDDIATEVGTIIIFSCNHCPFVLHVNEEIVRLAKDYQAKGMGVVAISSNDVVRYPQDTPDKMKSLALTEGYTFPYLYDESQEIAKAYDAACTPDFYVFDGQNKLYYRGRLDTSRPGNNEELTGKDLRSAIESMLAGQAAPSHQYPSAGCGIKWK